MIFLALKRHSAHLSPGFKVIGQYRVIRNLLICDEIISNKNNKTISRRLIAIALK
jgi:hypothetical protein